MALVLSLREGDDVYIGGTRIYVARVYEDHSFMLEVEHPDEIEEIDIDDSAPEEVLDGVFIAADAKVWDGTARLVIDAPMHIGIIRGARHRRETEGDESAKLRVTARAWDQAKKLGFEERDEVVELAVNARPTSHPNGNRVNGLYVLHVLEGSVRSIVRTPVVNREL